MLAHRCWAGGGGSARGPTGLGMGVCTPTGQQGTGWAQAGRCLQQSLRGGERKTEERRRGKRARGGLGSQTPGLGAAMSRKGLPGPAGLGREVCSLGRPHEGRGGQKGQGARQRPDSGPGMRGGGPSGVLWAPGPTSSSQEGRTGARQAHTRGKAGWALGTSKGWGQRSPTRSPCAPRRASGWHQALGWFCVRANEEFPGSKERAPQTAQAGWHLWDTSCNGKTLTSAPPPSIQASVCSLPLTQGLRVTSIGQTRQVTAPCAAGPLSALCAPRDPWGRGTQFTHRACVPLVSRRPHVPAPMAFVPWVDWHPGRLLGFFSSHWKGGWAVGFLRTPAPFSASSEPCPPLLHPGLGGGQRRAHPTLRAQSPRFTLCVLCPR